MNDDETITVDEVLFYYLGIDNFQKYLKMKVKEKISKKQLQMLVEFQFDRYNPNFVLIIDDCMTDTKWTKSPCFNECVFNGRHPQIHLFVTTQYYKLMSKSLRASFDFVLYLG